MKFQTDSLRLKRIKNLKKIQRKDTWVLNKSYLTLLIDALQQWVERMKLIQSILKRQSYLNLNEKCQKFSRFKLKRLLLINICMREFHQMLKYRSIFQEKLNHIVLYFLLIFLFNKCVNFIMNFWDGSSWKEKTMISLKILSIHQWWSYCLVL